MLQHIFDLDLPKAHLVSTQSWIYPAPQKASWENPRGPDDATEFPNRKPMPHPYSPLSLSESTENADYSTCYWSKVKRYFEQSNLADLWECT